MKRLNKAFTLVELLVVISIIALLVAILMPALGKVRTQAKVAALNATFHSITMGLEQFRDDQGSYPLSSRVVNPVGLSGIDEAGVNMGAHWLVEALAGNDLLGHEPSSRYYYTRADGKPADWNDNELERKGPYVPADKMDVINFQTDSNPAKAYGEAGFSGIADLETNRNPVFVDNFKSNRHRPILYFKANKRNTTMSDSFTVDDKYVNNIFDFGDNDLILSDNGMIFDGVPTGNEAIDLKLFSYFTWDRKTGISPDPFLSTSSRPYNSDSFILWSAGPDGEYGTGDDVTNFERK